MDWMYGSNGTQLTAIATGVETPTDEVAYPIQKLIVKKEEGHYLFTINFVAPSASCNRNVIENIKKNFNLQPDHQKNMKFLNKFYENNSSNETAEVDGRGNIKVRLNNAVNVKELFKTCITGYLYSTARIISENERVHAKKECSNMIEMMNKDIDKFILQDRELSNEQAESKQIHDAPLSAPAGSSSTLNEEKRPSTLKM